MKKRKNKKWKKRHSNAVFFNVFKNLKHGNEERRKQYKLDIYKTVKCLLNATYPERRKTKLPWTWAEKEGGYVHLYLSFNPLIKKVKSVSKYHTYQVSCHSQQFYLNSWIKFTLTYVNKLLLLFVVFCCCCCCCSFDLRNVLF